MNEIGLPKRIQSAPYCCASPALGIRWVIGLPLLAGALLCLYAEMTLSSSLDDEGGWCTGAPPTKIGDFFWDPFEDGMNQHPSKWDAPAKVLHRFGEPVAKELKTVPQEPGIDNVVQLWKYDGLTVNMSGASEQSAIVESVSLSSNQYPLKGGIRFGDTRSELIEKFVENLGLDRNEVRLGNLRPGGYGLLEEYYCTPQSGQVTIAYEFEFKDDRLIKLSWRYDGRM